MSEATEEQWHVQIEAGDVRLWTLDQLDAAFKAELVDESTFVLEVGKTEWMQLGTLLGGDLRSALGQRIWRRQRPAHERRVPGHQSRQGAIGAHRRPSATRRTGGRKRSTR